MKSTIQRSSVLLGALGLLLGTVPAASAQGHPTPPDGAARVLWRFEIPSKVSGQHVGVGSDGRVYTTSFNPPYLYAFTPRGSLQWTLPVGEGGYWPITFAEDGTIYTGTARGIRAVNPEGTIRWSFDLASWFDAGPGVGPDGNIYAVDNELGFFSLDPGGALRWSNAGNPAVLGLYFDADEIVFGDGRLFGGVHFLRSGPWISTYAFDLDGNQLWFRQIVGLEGGPSSNPRLLPDGRLAFRWGAGSLSALNQNGSDAWVEPHPDGSQELATPAVGPDGALYAGDQYGVQLWSADPDGTTRWVRGVGADEHLEAVGLGVSPDNRVLVASGWTYSQPDGLNHGWVRGYDPADGDLLWQIDLEIEQGLTQVNRTVRPAFSSNGDTVYLTTWFVGNGVGHTYLYAIALREPTTGVPEEIGGRLERPLVFVAPNPCFEAAKIVAATGSIGPASVAVYDVAGRVVRRLFGGPIARGELRLDWDLRDDQERPVDSGVYFVGVRTPDGMTTTRIVVTR